MKICFKNYQSPGDIVVMTGAIRDLKKQYPRYEIAVDTTCIDIWQNNPHISWFNENQADKSYRLGYDDIQNSDASGRHFSNAFHIQIEDILGIQLYQSKIWPELYLNDNEKQNRPIIGDGYKGKYWLLNAGYKSDFSLKHWGTMNYQEVVDRLKGKVKFVQVGEDSPNHFHLPIDGAINMIGKTSFREYIRLSYHSEGSIGPVSMHMHISAAFRKPSVIIAGGREPFRWEAYPNQRYICTNGYLPCCELNACWKNWLRQKVTPQIKKQVERDGENWEDKVCNNMDEMTAKCMKMITPEMVEKEILGYYIGGVLETV